MVYNEARNLPRWLEHYSAQVGPENCIVIDHESDDGSTEKLCHPVGRLGLPRHRPFSEHPRAAFISGITTSLLEYFDGVLYADCDEYVIADPRRYETLRDLFVHEPISHFTALGFDVVHSLDDEPALDPHRGLLEQRRHALFSQFMCKTVLVRTPISWGGGFHTSDRPPQLSALYLFHAKNADIEARLTRTSVTRNITMSPDLPPRHNAHWRLSDEEVLERARLVDDLPAREWNDEMEERAIEDLRSRVTHERSGPAGKIHRYTFRGNPPDWLAGTRFTFSPDFHDAV